MEASQTGLPGLSVVSHVVMELNSVPDHAPIHRLQTVENNAEDFFSKNENASFRCVRHQVDILGFSSLNESYAISKPIKLYLAKCCCRDQRLKLYIT